MRNPMIMFLIIIIAFSPALLVYSLPEGRTRVFVGAWSYTIPEKGGSFNPLVWHNLFGMSFYMDLIYETLAWYYAHNDTLEPRLAESWELKGDEFIVHLRRDVVWHNGEPFTAKDVVCTFYLYKLLGLRVWEYLDYVKALDPHTVVFKIKKWTPFLPRLILRHQGYRLGANYILPYSVFGNFSDEVIRRLAYGEPLDDLRTAFFNYRPDVPYIGTGPFMWTGEVTESELWLKKFEKHRDADKIGFDWIRIIRGETADITPFMLAKEIDYATHGFPPATLKQLGEIGYKFLRLPRLFGPALYFNLKMYPFNLTEFRKAIAYAINREENCLVTVGPGGVPEKYLVGFPGSQVARWLTEETLAKLEKYEYDPEKAMKILEGLGFKRGPDGVLVAPDGTRMEFELITIFFADRVPAAENIAKQLEKIGIKVKVKVLNDWSAYMNALNTGNFEMWLGWYGDQMQYHPLFSYELIFLSFNYPSGLGPGISFDLVQDTKTLGRVNVTELLEKAATGTPEEQSEAINKLALAFNELLPGIPLFEYLGYNPYLDGVRVTGWLPEDDPLYENAVYADNPVVMMIAKGILKPT